MRINKIETFVIISSDSWNQGTNARKVDCGRAYSAYILNPVLSADLVNKIRCISVLSVKEVKSMKFFNSEHSQLFL